MGVFPVDATYNDVSSAAGVSAVHHPPPPKKYINVHSTKLKLPESFRKSPSHGAEFSFHKRLEDGYAEKLKTPPSHSAVIVQVSNGRWML